MKILAYYMPISCITCRVRFAYIYFDIIFAEHPKGITIIIRDTGNGIDPETAKKIFDPFFTTKEDGIGLGLFISKQIVENHGGNLEFSSRPGKGTEFRIWLPEIVSFVEEER